MGFKHISKVLCSEDDDLLLAAVLCPQFKLIWVNVIVIKVSPGSPSRSIRYRRLCTGRKLYI